MVCHKVMFMFISKRKLRYCSAYNYEYDATNTNSITENNNLIRNRFIFKPFPVVVRIYTVTK